MENEFVAWLRNSVTQDPRLKLGPGDDAAILNFADRDRCVITSDLLADGTHFNLSDVSPRRIARKAIAVNLSDLAAMAARPHSATVSLLLPRANAGQLAHDLFEGILPIAGQFHLLIAGGDTNCWDGPLVIAITAIGEHTEHGPFLRSGARPGDSILVTGFLGGSILGRHYDFTPRVNESLYLAANYDVHAAIDISDGLSLDLSRICQASQCGATLDLARLPLSDAVSSLVRADDDLQESVQHGLADGEDFELLLALAESEANRLLHDQPLSVPVTRIGSFIHESGLWSQQPDGTRMPLAITGFEHGS